MTTNSFRQVTLNRPLEYRTPSPPIAAIEPISPLPADCLREHGGTQLPSKRTYHQSIADSLDIAQIVTTSKIRDGAADPQGAMDSFASIALSTGLDIAPRRSSHQEQASGRSGMVFASGNDQKDRSAKRARSEKLPSPRSRRTSVVKSARPATSYGDTRIIEAELLLNFAQEARFSVPPPSHWKDSTHAASSTHAAISMNPTGRPFPSTGSKSERNGDATHDPEPPQYIIRDERSTTTKLSEQTCGESGFSTLGQAPHSAHRPSSSHHPGAMVPDGTSISERAAFDMPADEFAGTIDVNSSIRNAEIHYKEELSPRQQAQMQMAVQNTAIQSELNGTEARDGLATQYTHYPTFAPQMPENVGPGNPMCTASFQVGNDMSPDDPSVETSDSSQDVGTDITTSIVRPELGSEEIDTDPDAHAKTAEIAAPAVCAGCSFTRTIMNGEVDINSTSWISCDACKCWFHFACAGFKNEREVRSVDKYRCRKCKPIHGSTTYVRKSSRAHSSIDYAGLHQGVIKTSDDTPEHHYIQPIKEGTITFLPETFPRMRPELVTAEYFEQCHGWREPIVVPAAFNPQARFAVESSAPAASASAEKPFNVTATAGSAPEVWAFDGSESQYTPDHGQDALDMVMPQGLTVRKVAELYGPEEKVEVIDVKSQNGEGKKWNMRRWADYYESSGDKVVRNVISLEVSQSRLGRLIRRPQIVRDLDLQDSVWPTELQAKGEIPRVQFYCLMSVADCFTDFHIDFGGSSVFYHILKGKKTFFFIPPKEKHLKKYEEWCLSPAQNWTFLGGQTKECYRVDLSEGDTMLIPAGWIHAVWTPEDSLVIGGNFLTRLNYGMQLRIAQIEKATGVARKFRYPHFQKIHWYAAFRYLEEDPLPSTVKEQLQAGGVFRRERPSHYDFNDWGENSRSGPENYHTRYYSQAELEGLPDLVRYLLRTAMIDMGSITDGITAETRNAVKRSIPRGHGEPLDVVKDLAVWCAWKRGNETIPSWAYPDAVPEPEVAGKIGVAAQKKLDREAALQAPRRQSARMQSLQHSAPAHAQGKAQQKDPDPSNSAVDTADDDSMHDSIKRRVPESNPNNPYSTQSSASSKRREATSGTGSKPHRKIACESCRKRRRACKHKDFRSVVRPSQQAPDVDVDGDPSILPSPSSLQTSVLSDGVDVTEANQEFPPGGDSEVLARIDPSITMQQLMDLSPDAANLTDADRERLDQEMKYLLKHPGEIASTPKMLTHLSGAGLLRLEHRIAGGPVNGLSVLSLNAPHSRGRTKACNDCRKSKVSYSTRMCCGLGRLTHLSSDDAYMTSMVTKIRSRPVKPPCPGQPRRTSEENSIVKAMIFHQLQNCGDPLGPRLIVGVTYPLMIRQQIHRWRSGHPLLTWAGLRPARKCSIIHSKTRSPPLIRSRQLQLQVSKKMTAQQAQTLLSTRPDNLGPPRTSLHRQCTPKGLLWSQHPRFLLNCQHHMQSQQLRQKVKKRRWWVCHSTHNLSLPVPSSRLPPPNTRMQAVLHHRHLT